MPETHFIRPNTGSIELIFMWWEKCRKNCKIVLTYLYTRKVTNKRRKTIKTLPYIMNVIKYILNFKIEIESTNMKVCFEFQNWFRKGRSWGGPLFVWNYLLNKRREFNPETYRVFLGYVEGFNKLKRDKHFEILQRKMFSICYWKV